MNPQFQPPQSFTQNRASPALTQQQQQQGNFQNIPLGPQKPGGPISNGPAQAQSNIPSSFPPQGGPFQPPPSSQYGPPGGMRAPPANRGFSGIPPNQLPPQSANLGQSGMPPTLNKNQLPPSGPAGGLPPPPPSNANLQGFPSGERHQLKLIFIYKIEIFFISTERFLYFTSFLWTFLYL